MSYKVKVSAKKLRKIVEHPACQPYRGECRRALDIVLETLDAMRWENQVMVDRLNAHGIPFGDVRSSSRPEKNPETPDSDG